jgi:hypothetical protein
VSQKEGILPEGGKIPKVEEEPRVPRPPTADYSIF